MNRYRYFLSTLALLPFFLISVFIGSQFAGLSSDNLSAALGQASITSPAPVTAASYITNLNTRIGTLSNSYRQTKLANLKNNLGLTLRTLAIDRKNEMLKLAKADPHAFLKLVLPASTLALLPPEVSPQFEKLSTVRSPLGVIHVDDFVNHKNHKYLYKLNQTNQSINFYPTEAPNLISGAVVEVTGYQLADALVAETSTKGGEVSTNFKVITPPPAITDSSLGEQKTLVLLVDFLDSGPRPFTAVEARDLIFGDNRDSNLNKFYLEQSYGKTWLTGDVKGWYKLDRNYDPESNYCAGNSDSELEDTVNNNQLDLAPYSRVVLLINHDSAPPGCGSVGKRLMSFNSGSYSLSVSSIGGLSFYDSFPVSDIVSNLIKPFPWTDLDFAFSHELGHNLGLWHSNGLDCGSRTMGGSDVCEALEYGNLYDSMGEGIFSLHFNAWYKKMLGWLGPQDILEINQPGRYEIKNLESSSGPRLVEFSAYGGSYPSLFAEYRRGTGFNQGISDSLELSSAKNGLLVNKINQAGETGTFLLDSQPTNDWWDRDIKIASVDKNHTLGDPDLDIRIGPVISNDDDSITFNVLYGGAGFNFVYPTDGVEWIPGQTYSLRWQSNDLPATQAVSLTLMTASGSRHPFVPIINTVNDGEYNVVFPIDIATGEFYYRISTVVDGASVEANSGIFKTLSPLTVTSHRDYFTTWPIGDSQLVTWNTSSIPSGAKITIHLEDDSDTHYTLASNLANDFSENVVMPDFVPPGDYLLNLHLILADGSTHQSYSRGNVIVSGNIILASPVENENIESGSIYTLNWQSKGIPPSASLDIILRNFDSEIFSGRISPIVTTSTVFAVAGSGAYSFTVPNLLAGRYLLEISTFDNFFSRIFVKSKLFNIVEPSLPSSTINLISPNGGEIWAPNSNQNISWSSSNVPEDARVTIYFKSEPDNQYYILPGLFDLPNTGTANLTPNLPSGKYFLYLEARSSSGNLIAADSSNGLINISSLPQPSLKIISPNGGEAWSALSQQTIRWSSTDVPANTSLRITLNDQNGQDITSFNTSNDGQETINVPNFSANSNDSYYYEIGYYDTRISRDISDRSDGNFIISNSGQAAITITGREGGPDLIRGQISSQKIYWQTTNIPASAPVTLELIKVSTGQPIAGSVTTTNTGSYPLSIYNNAPLGTYRIRLTATAYSQTFTTNSETFNLIAPTLPTITVTSPSGPSNWPAGSGQTISWQTSGGSTPNTVNLFLKNSSGEHVFNGQFDRMNVSNTGSAMMTMPSTTGQYRYEINANFGGTIVSGESVLFTVVPVLLSIINTDPPDRSNDARQPQQPDGSGLDDWQKVLVNFSGPANAVTKSDFSVGGYDIASPNPVAVPFTLQAGNSANQIRLNFNPPDMKGRRIEIRYLPNPNSSSICLGYLPGDVNNDNQVTVADQLALIDGINGVPGKPRAYHQVDINRSGEIGNTDLTRLVDLFNGAGAYDPWLGRSIPGCRG